MTALFYYQLLLITDNYIEISLPNHLVKCLASVPSALAPSIALLNISKRSVSVFRKPTPTPPPKGPPPRPGPIKTISYPLSDSINFSIEP